MKVFSCNNMIESMQIDAVGTENDIFEKVRKVFAAYEVWFATFFVNNIFKLFTYHFK